MNVFAYGAFEDFEDGFFGHGCACIGVMMWLEAILFFNRDIDVVWSHAMLLEMSKY